MNVCALLNFLRAERGINMNTFISAYNRAPALSVYGAYKHPSDAKVRAERAILREMTQRNGWGYKVINHTCQHFTAGYLFTDPDTGVITLCVRTAQNAYEMDWCKYEG